MSSRVEKVKIELVCARCSMRIHWAWVIQNKSFRYTQLVYVCSQCGSVIKVMNALKGPDTAEESPEGNLDPVIKNPQPDRTYPPLLLM